jgi:transmembrane sensor
MTTESAETIARRAAEWVVRGDRGVDDRTLAELKAWMVGDPRRRGALLKAEATWALLDRARALSSLPNVSRRKQALRWTAGLAATAAIACLSLFLFQLMVREDYRTTIGEVRRITLSDGSLAEINTASRLAVRIEDESRVVTLERGEAWFRVAKDNARPFVVEAGAVRVRALGTAFSVRRRDPGAEIVVSEGVVEAWIAEAQSNKLRLEAGSKVVLHAKQTPADIVRARAEIERSLAWRSGQIALQGETLGEAAAEFNRYNARKLVIEDSSVAREQLVGWFHTHEPEGFARAVASSLGAHVEVNKEQIRISRTASP